MPPKPTSARHVISLRVTDAVKESVDLALQQMNLTRTEFMELAVSLALANTAHQQFAEPPTENQRSGMRARTLAILRDGKPYTPAELAQRLGCGENAASAYARNLRRAQYGGHNVLSKPVMREGKRTSVYWLEVAGE
jgi:antitoxin component of RelBE/YafQ-DinJ toxin-antitoxin module